MSLARPILTNTIWMVGGRILVTAASLLLTGILTRSLGVFGYGELSIAVAYMAFANVVGDLGFYELLVREVSRRSSAIDQQEVANNILTLRIVLTAFVYAGAAALVFAFPYSHNVQLSVVILAIVNFLLTTSNTLVGIFQAHQRIQPSVVSEVISRLILVGLVLLVAPLHWPLPKILALYAASALLGLALNGLFVGKYHRIRFIYQLDVWKNLLRETWVLGLVTVVMVLYFKIDSVILSVLKTPVEVAIYAVPYKILEVLLFIPTMFGGNILPVLSRLGPRGGIQLHQLIQASFDGLILAGFSIAAGIILLAPQIVRVVAGEEFVTASSLQLTIGAFSVGVTAPMLLRILAMAMAAIFIAQLWSVTLVALGKQRLLIRPALFALVTNIALNFLLIPRGSYLAAALVTLLTEAFVCVANGRLVFREVPMRLSSTRLRKGAAATLVMSLAVWPVRDLPLLLPIAVGATSYLASLWLLRALPAGLFHLFGRRAQ